MKYFKLFENFISEPLNEAMSFDEVKDKYIENPYGIGAQIIELIEGPAGRRMLVFKHDNKYDRDKIEANLKSIGIPAKKLSTSKADKAYKYPYEVTLHESEAFDINEGKIDKATIMVAKHKAGHMVMNVHHWNEERHLKDYMDSNKNSGDNFYEVSKKELDSKIADLQKEYNVKDKDIQVYEAKVNEYVKDEEERKSKNLLPLDIGTYRYGYEKTQELLGSLLKYYKSYLDRSPSDSERRFELLPKYHEKTFTNAKTAWDIIDKSGLSSKLQAAIDRYHNNKKSTVSEANDPNLTPDQNHMYTLMDYIIMDYNEDDFDVLEYRIGKKLKKADWKYSDITDDKTAEIKEILKTYYNRKKIITDKFLKNPAKKWQDLIAAMKWLNA